MGKLVVLNLDGNFRETGLRVTLELANEGYPPFSDKRGFLPPNPELAKKLQEHSLEKYRQIGSPARIKAKKVKYVGSVNESIQECLASAQQLKTKLNQWLATPEFNEINNHLRTELSPQEVIRFLIRTDDTNIIKLPWEEWQFLADYTKTEVSFATPEFSKLQPNNNQKKQAKVRILAILGHSENIDVVADRQLLENLPESESLFLVQPQRQVINDALWDQPWDIIFFAGHSITENDEGKIYLNEEEESLTIDEVWYALRTAVNNGLKLAIFNSCDGLGLAKRLDDLNIPQMIVMRELVPDQVAQQFLKYFLKAFSGGKSLNLAAREAREKLQGLESKFPCASWLPVIFQNLGEVAPTWEDLKGVPQVKTKLRVSWRQGLQTVLLTSLVVTSLVIGLRSLGWLEASELRAYDNLTTLKPVEERDSRILVVKITEKDIEIQEASQRGSSLPDSTLEKLLDILEPLEPKVIGLDIFRDFPVGSQYQKLSYRLTNNDHIIATCLVGDEEQETDIAAPPEIVSQRVGFSDLTLDLDGKLRRHMLGMASGNSKCQSDKSLSLQIALRYLREENMNLKLTEEDNIKLGSVIFKNLIGNFGGYHQLDGFGYQVMLNYRSGQEPFEQISLHNILNKSFDPKLVNNRAILIGTVASSFNNDVITPYSSSKGLQGNLPGVIIQAHLVSQILSTVLDKRPLIWTWAKWLEVCWIGTWSLIGGILAWQLHWRTIWLGFAVIVTLSLLYAACFVSFTQLAGWLPLIPSSLNLLVTGVIVSCLLVSSKKLNI